MSRKIKIDDLDSNRSMANQEIRVRDLDEKQRPFGIGAELVLGASRTKRLNKRAIQEAVKGATKIGEHALNEAKTRHARNAEFGQAVQRPLLEIIKNNPAARAALGGTRLESFIDVSPPRLGRAPSLLSLTLHDSLNITSAPYDFEWHWGNSFRDFPSRITGRIAIQGKAGDQPGGVHDPVRSACGVGVLLRSNSPSFVSVRPLVAYRYSFLTQSNGLWIGASSRGGIDISAWQGPTMVAPVRRSELWSSSVYSGVGDGQEVASDGGGGFAWVPDLEIKFSMQPDLDYVVNVGAWIECDLSSGAGVHGADDLVDGNLRLLFVERLS